MEPSRAVSRPVPSASPSAPVATLLDRLNAGFPRVGTEVTDAAVARRQLDALRGPAVAPTPLHAVVDAAIVGPDGDALRIRRYLPRAAPAADAVVYLHGGGFVLGDLDSHDEIARRIARAGDVELIAVDYRRAPEHPYPAALRDAVAVVERVAAEPRTGRLLVAGDSAGGNLAAAAAMHARDRGGPTIDGQLLLYPMLDDRRDTPSYRENGDGFYITAAHLAWFWAQYGGAPDPLAAPARAAQLAGLPPAHVVTADLDPLRDEGEAFAAALARAGVPVSRCRYADAFHGFLAFPDQLEVTRRAFAEIGAAIASLAGRSDAVGPHHHGRSAAR